MKAFLKSSLLRTYNSTTRIISFNNKKFTGNTNVSSNSTNDIDNKNDNELTEEELNKIEKLIRKNENIKAYNQDVFLSKLNYFRKPENITRKIVQNNFLKKNNEMLNKKDDELYSVDTLDNSSTNQASNKSALQDQILNDLVQEILDNKIYEINFLGKKLYETREEKHKPIKIKKTSSSLNKYIKDDSYLSDYAEPNFEQLEKLKIKNNILICELDKSKHAMLPNTSLINTIFGCLALITDIVFIKDEDWLYRHLDFTIVSLYCSHALLFIAYLINKEVCKSVVIKLEINSDRKLIFYTYRGVFRKIKRWEANIDDIKMLPKGNWMDINNNQFYIKSNKNRIFSLFPNNLIYQNKLFDFLINKDKDTSFEDLDELSEKERNMNKIGKEYRKKNKMI